MRTHGTLVKWNDERGFGFVSQGPSEIFVHISAFRNDGRRPVLNEMISFETELGPNGKLRAVKVMRPGGSTNRLSAGASRRDYQAPRSRVGGIAALLALVLAVFVYSKYHDRVTPLPETSTVRYKPNAVAAPTGAFRCDGRTQCSQMNSCAEAMYFLANCPNTQMDGNNDGEPCEQQWCN